MTEVHNVVFVKHSPCDKAFLFLLPGNTKLKKDCPVIVDTMRGHRQGSCACDSFLCDTHTLNCIVEGVDAYFPLKKVVGTVETIHRTEIVPIDWS